MTNPESVVDTDALTVTRTIRIAAPVAAVWRAITEPALISRWFGEAALDENGVGTLTWDDYGAVPVRVEARDEPQSITYRWTNDDAAGPEGLPSAVRDDCSTVFTFTLDDLGEATQLTVVETGFESTTDPLGNLESHRDGWNSELDELVALLEEAAA